MQKLVVLTIAAIAVAVGSQAVQASSVSEREYKRGYNDCLVGEYDQNQHGDSYKRGCRAAEESGQTTGEKIRVKADKSTMKIACRAALVGRFHPYLRSVNVQSQDHTKSGWTFYGEAVMDDASRSQFVCIFSSSGHLKRLNASEPQGEHYGMDPESYCPPDVSEANRYMFPGCN